MVTKSTVLDALVLGSFAIYCATFMLGLGIKLRWWHTRRFRWMHHALFAGIWVSLGATTLVARLNAARAWFAPLGVLLWMAPLPCFRPGGRMHQFLAAGGLATFVASILMLRER
ncbi:MAG: hypothetical protein MI924_17135 [Chloroflexales bacterium]|nr:hypothetical protein [Chloroflexales bacterium]